MYLTKTLAIIAALAVFRVAAKDEPNSCEHELATACGAGEDGGVIYDCNPDGNGGLVWEHRIDCGGPKCCNMTNRGAQCICGRDMLPENYCQAQCGNKGGAPGPDNAIYQCTYDDAGVKQWKMLVDCSTADEPKYDGCCMLKPGQIFPTCELGCTDLKKSGQFPGVRN